LATAAYVNPAMLKWSRERAGFDIFSAAGKLKIEAGRLEKWEIGSDLPSISQARKLAETYKRPFAAFFLPSPPSEFSVLNEYRRFTLVPAEVESPQLRFAIRTAALRREAFIEANEAAGVVLLPLSMRAAIGEDADEVGSRIRSYLNVSIEGQLKWNSNRSAFAAWRGAFEAKNILVFQVPQIELDEMRGALLPSEKAAVIAVNSKDAFAGKIFTLIHEFVHLLLYVSGHQTPAGERRRPLSKQRVEVFANAIAAATLLPRDQLLRDARLKAAAEGLPRDMVLVEQIAKRFRVSAEVVVRRLVSLRMASLRDYQHLRDAGRFNVPRKGQRKSAPIPPEVKTLSQLGVAFTSSMIEAYHRRQVSGPALVDYLGLRLKNLQRLENRIFRTKSVSDLASIVE
jgi:Zn-dependent peptidase ImmA (M78 family)/transcriptional regulator with XRE-family HTH domain